MLCSASLAGYTIPRTFRELQLPYAISIVALRYTIPRTFGELQLSICVYKRSERPNFPALLFSPIHELERSKTKITALGAVIS